MTASEVRQDLAEEVAKVSGWISFYIVLLHLFFKKDFCRQSAGHIKKASLYPPSFYLYPPPFYLYPSTLSSVPIHPFSCILHPFICILHPFICVLFFNACRVAGCGGYICDGGFQQRVDYFVLNLSNPTLIPQFLSKTN